MSTLYQTDVTLTVDGDEADYCVRAYVGRGARGAVIDGEIEVYVPAETRMRFAWVSIDSLDVDAADRDRCEEALCDVANEDDRDQCVELYEDGTVGL